MSQAQKKTSHQAKEAGQHPEEFFFTAREVFQHLILMVILWGLLYFEFELMSEILTRWADPYYTTGLFGDGGRLPEMVAFALTVVMAVYTLGITVIFLSDVIIRRFRRVNFHKYIRLNTVVLTSFVVYWVLFVSLFVKI